MEEILIKSFAKKVIVNTNGITVNKSIGKDLEIPLNNINDISYVEGTSKEAGLLHIDFINSDGEINKESIPFNYVYNDIVEEVTRGILNYLENPNEPLTINPKEKVGFFSQVNREAKNPKPKKIDEEKERLLRLKKEGIPYCPKCKSTSLTTTNKKLSVGRAAVGGVLLGGAGAILGGLTSKKVELLCMNCGNKFKPGKR